MKTSMSPNVLSIRTSPSQGVKSQSLNNPSTDAAKEHEKSEDRSKPFRFLDLPSELRNKIYDLHFGDAPPIIDLDPDNFRTIFRKFSLFLASRQIHEEASHRFYSTHGVRLFPIHPGRFFYTKKPLLSRLPLRYRASITSLQLRLGPGFTHPPRCWVVNRALGLKDVTSVRFLSVFVQVDTSDAIYNGFRRGEGFYENFSAKLLRRVLKSVSSITEVQFDAYMGIRMDGEMMKGLLKVARDHKKLISWGPERGWATEPHVDTATTSEMGALPATVTTSEISVSV